MLRERRRSDLLSAATGFALGLSAWAIPLEVAMAQARLPGNSAACRPPSSTAPHEALQLAVSRQPKLAKRISIDVDPLSML